MKKKDFWFLSLVVLLIISLINGWNLYLRIAVAANALLVLYQVSSRISEHIKATKDGEK